MSFEIDATTLTVNNQPLEDEKIIFCENMREFLESDARLKPTKGKDVESSISYFELARERYNESDRMAAWENYTRSIATAPDDSKQLAICYIKRAELLYEFSKFEDCIKDCDNGIGISDCLDLQKALPIKLKIMCLKFLKDNRLNDEIASAWKYLNNLREKENPEIYDNHPDVQKLKVILELEKSGIAENSKGEKEETRRETSTFEYQKAFSRTSRVVKIEHDKNWGRHIVATRDIEPGEILVVEKSHFTSRRMANIHPFCFNCMKSTWALIPCDNCIYDLYCSEQCISEAWKKYHRFECDVFPYLWKLDKPPKNSILCLRFMLISVYNAGGIDKMKEVLVRNEEAEGVPQNSCSDIFDINNIRSIYNLSSGSVNIKKTKEKKGSVKPTSSIFESQIKFTCYAIYLLGVKTDFFGKKSENLFDKISEDKNISFIGALLLRTLLMFPRNCFAFDAYNSTVNAKMPNYIKKFGVSLYPYCSFFNHSCCPNAMYLTSKNHELVVIAKYPIKQDSQVFVSYHGYDYLSVRKVARIDFLIRTYGFMCKCEACEKDWPVMSALKRYSEHPELNIKTFYDIRDILRSLDNLKCDKNSIEKIADALKTLYHKYPAYQYDYEELAMRIFEIHVALFGNILICAFYPHL